MSGRSAYVRKKTVTLAEKPAPKADREVRSLASSTASPPASIRSVTPSIASGSSETHSRNAGLLAYGHGSYGIAQRPAKPVIVKSQIEKSSFREVMDLKSDQVRTGVKTLFGVGKKKKKDKEKERGSIRPETSNSQGQRIGTSYELDSHTPHPPPYGMPPPTGQLPALPVSFKQWGGKEPSPRPWSKSLLRRDPALWDDNGDVLVYIQHEFPTGDKIELISPSYRLRSDAIDQSGMGYLKNAMRLAKGHAPQMPPSPISSPSPRYFSPQAPHLGRYQSGPQTPPISEDREYGDGFPAYEMYLPLPSHYREKSPAEILHFNITVRNALAVIIGAPIVGKDLTRVLTDVQEHLEGWFDRPQYSASHTVAKYLESQELDNINNNPAIAIALLNWAESPSTKWTPLYTETFVHLAGMYNRLNLYPEFKNTVSRTSREMLDRANLDMQDRIEKVEDRLKTFDFPDMWRYPNDLSGASRATFERLRVFFIDKLTHIHGTWPPPVASGEDNWLTRTLAKSLQNDFGALYDYLVDREVEWDVVEERPGPKWGFKKNGKCFEGNTPELHLTDCLRSWDTSQGFEHIPHPYPLIPKSIPVKTPSKENLFKASRKLAPKDERLAHRRFALAFSESTNMHDSDMPPNKFVEDFLEFEKVDYATLVDPLDARRGRWMLIYAVMQVLAEVSADVPYIHYTSDNVSYHLSASLSGTPPWDRTIKLENASHNTTYCWRAAKRWTQEKAQQEINKTLPSRTPSMTSTSGYSDGEPGPSRRYNEYPALSPKSPKRALQKNSLSPTASEHEFFYSNTGYARGIERVDSWPIRERLDSQRLANQKAASATASQQLRPNLPMILGRSGTTPNLLVEREYVTRSMSESDNGHVGDGMSETFEKDRKWIDFDDKNFAG